MAKSGYLLRRATHIHFTYCHASFATEGKYLPKVSWGVHWASESFGDLGGGFDDSYTNEGGYLPTVSWGFHWASGGFGDLGGRF